MTSLKGKKIILGITGSIAAYKTPELVRQFVKKGAEVQVILSEEAKMFVTKLALSTVSKRPSFDAFEKDGVWNNHVSIGRWADLFLLAPCSAQTLAKLANGFCDNLLMATYLSANCPVLIAPAMDSDMWQHPAVQKNIETIKSFPHHQIIPVGEGELASGLHGAGRMAELEDIVSQVETFFNQQSTTCVSNSGVQRALVTAGPTYEAIDPVRFIGNYSSGKMGTALALALKERGYQVDLVIGPGVIPIQSPGIILHQVTTAREMFEQCTRIFPQVDLAVMAAAVADYRPENPATQKIKKDKTHHPLQINLVENPDILAHLGAIKKNGQVLVGFALETQNELENARGKMERKKADYIVLNSLNDSGAGFGTDTNKVTLLSAKGEKIELPLQTKQKIAEELISLILE